MKVAGDLYSTTQTRDGDLQQLGVNMNMNPNPLSRTKDISVSPTSDSLLRDLMTSGNLKLSHAVRGGLVLTVLTTMLQCPCIAVC